MFLRVSWLIVGIFALLAGIAGVALPLVPATPFLLVAAFAFARSSARLHRWLLAHRHLGPPIHNWHRYGAISGRAKISAVVVMVATLAAGIVAGLSAVVLGVQATAMAASALFILTRPNPPGRSGRPSEVP